MLQILTANSTTKVHISRHALLSAWVDFCTCRFLSCQLGKVGLYTTLIWGLYVPCTQMSLSLLKCEVKSFLRSQFPIACEEIYTLCCKCSGSFAFLWYKMPMFRRTNISILHHKKAKLPKHLQHSVYICVTELTFGINICNRVSGRIKCTYFSMYHSSQIVNTSEWPVNESVETEENVFFVTFPACF